MHNLCSNRSFYSHASYNTSSLLHYRKKLPPIVDLVCKVCKIPKFLCEIVKSK